MRALSARATTQTRFISGNVTVLWEKTVTAFNAVRFRVKPGRDQEFLDAHKKGWRE